VIFAAAVLTDALDGTIARIRHQKTQLGAILDPFADKMLLVSSTVLFSLPITGLAQLPIWVLVTFISRDVILIFGAVVVIIQGQKLVVKPNIVGKITTFSQMLTVIWILLKWQSPNYIWRVAGALTIISGAIYIYQGSQRLGNNNENNSNSRPA
jgi:cardiolipin synthase